MRFSPLPIIWGHLKALRNARTGRRDWVALVVVLIPFAVAYAAAWVGWGISQPTGLIAGIAIMGGMLVSAFAQMTNLRLRLEDRSETHNIDPTHRQRDAIDETVTHLLMAVLLCVLAAIILVATLNTEPGTIRYTVLSAAAVWATSYIVLMILLVLPRMYYAYTETAKVKPELSGFHHGPVHSSEAISPSEKPRTSV